MRKETAVVPFVIIPNAHKMPVSRLVQSVGGLNWEIEIFSIASLEYNKPNCFTVRTTAIGTQAKGMNSEKIGFFLWKKKKNFLNFLFSVRQNSVFLCSWSRAWQVDIELQTPNVNYSWRTAPLTSKIAFYIFIQQT